jgi:hypothetical protein
MSRLLRCSPQHAGERGDRYRATQPRERTVRAKPGYNLTKFAFCSIASHDERPCRDRCHGMPAIAPMQGHELALEARAAAFACVFPSPTNASPSFTAAREAHTRASKITHRPRQQTDSKRISNGFQTAESAETRHPNASNGFQDFICSEATLRPASKPLQPRNPIPNLCGIRALARSQPETKPIPCRLAGGELWARKRLIWT